MWGECSAGVAQTLSRRDVPPSGIGIPFPAGWGTVCVSGQLKYSSSCPLYSAWQAGGGLSLSWPSCLWMQRPCTSRVAVCGPSAAANLYFWISWGWMTETGGNILPWLVLVESHLPPRIDSSDVKYWGMCLLWLISGNQSGWCRRPVVSVKPSNKWNKKKKIMVLVQGLNKNVTCSVRMWAGGLTQLGGMWWMSAVPVLYCSVRPSHALVDKQVSDANAGYQNAMFLLLWFIVVWWRRRSPRLHQPGGRRSEEQIRDRQLFKMLVMLLFHFHELRCNPQVQSASFTEALIAPCCTSHCI